MAQTAVTHGAPQHPTDLPKGYKPISAMEGDIVVPRGPLMGRRMRARMVQVVTLDQNHKQTLIELLGPPTNEDTVFVPCDGVVEMAQVHELIDYAKSRMAERAELRARRLKTNQELWREELLERYEQQMAINARRSVFGPYISRERTYVS